MKIYDVTNAIVVEEKEVILALFDNRYNSVMIIKPVIDEKTKEPRLKISDPDGVERLYWLEKFGMITEEEFQADVQRLAPLPERKKLYEMLKKELE